MKVVFTHTDFRIYWPARLSALTDYLKIKGIRLEIVEIAGAGSPYDFSKDTDYPHSNWHCLFSNRRMEEITPIEANEALRRKLNYLNPDIVFAGAIAFPSGAASVRWAVENRRKVIIFDNARIEDVPRSWVVDFVKRKIYSCTDAIFCPSKVWDDTYTYFGFKDYQIFYGLNVVDNSFWGKRNITGSTEIESGYIITVGRQISKKNFKFILKAYSDYRERTDKPKELVLVGDGPEHSDLVDFVIKSDLKNIKFLPFQTQEKLRSFYRNANYLVLASHKGETWGLVVNEAMACGLPVLVSNQVGCASTLVKDGINGYTFSPKNVGELTNLLFKMDGHTIQELSEMGDNSRAIISDWGLERFCDGVNSAIQFVSDSRLKKPGITARLLLRLWKGRYRPV